MSEHRNLTESRKQKKVYGPHKPRLERTRERRYHIYIPQSSFQSRNGVTLVENPWSTVSDISYACVKRCEDTYRNPAFEPFRPKEFFDDGGRLCVQSSHWEISNEGTGIVTPWVGNARVRYGLNPAISTGSDGTFDIRSLYPPDADKDTTSWHAAAFARCKPTNPVIQLAVFVAELRDLHQLIIKRLETIKDIANWWLAAQFGWKPLLADIRRFWTKVLDLDSVLDQLIRNNGKPVRRRVQLLDDHVSSQLFFTGGIGINRNTYIDWPGRTVRTSSWGLRILKEQSTQVWASGEFIYWLQDVTLPSTRAYLKAGLLGVRITPADIWDALPWSWMWDWFTNIGDILHSVSENVAERTVARYLYVMKHTTRRYTWTGTDGYYRCSHSHVYETKVREKAHPFGLAAGTDLTPLQGSILAALALKFY